MSDIEDIVRRHLQKVKRTGPDNIMALCPFHANYNTPAFTMNLSSGLYFCFSCHTRGNLRSFLLGVGYGRAQIERQFGPLVERTSRCIVVSVDPLRTEQTAPKNEALPEQLLGLFDSCPLDLVNDGFSEEMLRKFDVGFDNVHLRITYPLRKINGELVGISGRSVTGAYPKYKLYDAEYKKWDLPLHRTYKSHLLWNGHQVYPEVYFQNKPVIVVEGYKACMRVVASGATNTVAIMGSRISDLQRWQLERISQEVWLFLDNNSAGFNGTVHAGMSMGVPTRVVQYPDHREQPSDLSVEELHRALQQPVDFHRWLLEVPEAMEVYNSERSKIEQREIWRSRKQEQNEE